MDMCGHHGLKAVANGMLKGLQLHLLQPLGCGVNHWKFFMGIRACVPVPGKVFTTGYNTMVMEACNCGCPHETDFFGFRPEGPVSDDGVGRVGMDIQNRSHVHIDSDRTQFFSSHGRSLVGQFRRSGMGNRGRRRKYGEPGRKT